SCGHEYPKRGTVTHEAGELAELGKTAMATRDVKQSWYSQFLYIAQQRGYREGWVAHKYKEKFGVWPRGMSEIAIPATQETLNYVRSRAIAYAKKREVA